MLSFRVYSGFPLLLCSVLFGPSMCIYHGMCHVEFLSDVWHVRTGLIHIRPCIPIFVCIFLFLIACGCVCVRVLTPVCLLVCHSVPLCWFVSVRFSIPTLLQPCGPVEACVCFPNSLPLTLSLPVSQSVAWGRGDGSEKNSEARVWGRNTQLLL